MYEKQTDVDDLTNGRHVCLCYRTDAERQEVLCQFVSDGLASNAKVFYFAHREPVSDILLGLHWNGLDSRRYFEAGQLSIRTANDSYLAGGAFSAEDCMRGWIATIDDALSEGYAGIRVAADMSWALDGIPGSENLLEYERMLSGKVFAGRPLIGLCEFDERLFDAESISELRQAHEDGIVRAPAILDTLQLRVDKSFDPPGLRVKGSLTAETASDFEAALRHVVHTTAGDIRLDLCDMNEMDDTGQQAIVRIARELYFGRHLVIAGDPMQSLDFTHIANLPAFRFERSA